MGLIGGVRSTAQVAIVNKKRHLCRRERSLEVAWLRDFWEAVDAKSAFIWGLLARHPHIKGAVSDHQYTEVVHRFSQCLYTLSPKKTPLT